MADVAAAIRRVEESRQSHVDWAAHLRECDWCRDDKTTQATVGSIEHQEQIVVEYDNVLEILRGLA